jgi:hypothetical protein
LTFTEVVQRTNSRTVTGAQRELRRTKNAGDTSAVLQVAVPLAIVEVGIGESRDAVRSVDSPPLRGPRQRPLPAAALSIKPRLCRGIFTSDDSGKV